MFAINAILLALAILYSFICLKWQTSPQQQPLDGVNWLTDFFDKKHVAATIRTLMRSRHYHGKLHLWILLLAMCLYTFQRDEKPMSYLYTQLIFKWDVTSFSHFRTFQSTLFVLGQFGHKCNRNRVRLTIRDSLGETRSQFARDISREIRVKGEIIYQDQQLSHSEPINCLDK